jgi:hypothetical protein
LADTLRTILPRSLYRAGQEVVTHPRLADVERQVAWVSRTLAAHIYGDGLPRPAGPADREIKVRSQHGEDGVLLWLFSEIGPTDRRFVEFGVEDGRECNTANLSLTWGWSGLLLEADDVGVEAARRFYAEELGPRAAAVTIEQAFVSEHNIQPILTDAGFDGEFDLLSIDIDGQDYWIWEAITARPRVVVIEYNPSFGPDRRVTVPRDDSFRHDRNLGNGLYYGASLAAFHQLGAAKGYALVGVESSGTNAFFVRSDCIGRLAAVSAADAWRPSPAKARYGTVDEQLASLAGLPLQTV